MRSGLLNLDIAGFDTGDVDGLSVEAAVSDSELSDLIVDNGCVSVSWQSLASLSIEVVAGAACLAAPILFVLVDDGWGSD